MGARYVVQGSVESSPDRLRVTTRLWDASAGTTAREEAITGSPAEVPALRAELGRAVIAGLGLRLNQREARAFGPRPVREVHAQECFLRARQCLVRFTPEELERSLQILRYGLELVGESGLLYAAMGMVYWNLVYSGTNPDEELVREAEEYAAKALINDPELPQGYVLAGLIARMRGRPNEAVSALRRALALDPNNPDALHWLGALYALVGRSFAARALADRLLEIDPLTAMNLALPGLIAMTEGRFHEASTTFRRASDLDPNPTGASCTPSLSRVPSRWTNPTQSSID